MLRRMKSLRITMERIVDWRLTITLGSIWLRRMDIIFSKRSGCGNLWQCHWLLLWSQRVQRCSGVAVGVECSAAWMSIIRGVWSQTRRARRRIHPPPDWKKILHDEELIHKIYPKHYPLRNLLHEKETDLFDASQSEREGIGLKPTSAKTTTQQQLSTYRTMMSRWKYRTCQKHKRPTRRLSKKNMVH